MLVGNKSDDEIKTLYSIVSNNYEPTFIKAHEHYSDYNYISKQNDFILIFDIYLS